MLTIRKQCRCLKIGKDTEIVYKDGENVMLLLIGTPGCGKSWTVVTRQVADNSGESMIIDDKKGSIYKSTGEIMRRQGYNVIVLDSKNYTGNFQYNIFEQIHSSADVRKVTHFLLPDTLKGNDPFWLNSGRAMLQAIIEIAMKEEENLNIRKLMEYKNMCSPRFDPRTGARLENDMDRVIEGQKRRGINIAAHREYSNLVNSADDTLRSILAELHASLSFLENDELYRITEKTNFDLKDLGNKKTVLYIISSDTDNSLDPFIKLVYRQIIDELMSYADLKDSNMLDNHVRFILDDFASGSRIEGFPNTIANARSRNISITLCIQSVAQLRALYGEAAQCIMDCINYKVYFPSANYETQCYLAELLDKPVCDIQKFPATKLCFERIYEATRVIERFEGTKELLESMGENLKTKKINK